MAGIPEDNPVSVMDIMSSASTARDAALTAIDAAKEQDFAEAQKWLNRAGNAINAAQKEHNHMLSLEAQGKGPDFSVLLVHTEAHLTDATSMVDMAKQMVDMYKLIFDRLS